MKKTPAFFTLLLLFSVLVAGSAQAVSMYLWWPDGSTNQGTFDVGDDIVFNYTGIGPLSHPIETEIYWANLDNVSDSELLLYDLSDGGTWGQDLISTNGFDAGSYVVFGIASDLETGYEDEDYLYFNLIGEPNNPPEFTDNLSLYYSYNIDLSNVDVVNLANFAFDLDNDELDFYVDQSNTDLNVVDCDINSDSILNCDLEGVGTTTVDVIVSDGVDSDTATITLNVYEVIPQNNPPEFIDNLSLYYSYNIDLSNVNVVDLADYSFDLDNDELYFYVSEPNTNFSVVDCQIVSDSILNCNLNGVGTTTVDVIVSDTMDTDTATIVVEVFEDVPVNHPPEFTDDLQLYYLYNLNLGSVAVVDLADYSFDLDGDDLYYSVDESNTNPNVVDCGIILGSILYCDLEGVGSTFVDVIVSDLQANDTATIKIKVFEDTINHPPEFTANLSLYYSYNIDLYNVDVVDLADYSFDLDNDELFYYLDQSNTDFTVVDCQLDASSNKKRDSDSNTDGFTNAVSKLAIGSLFSSSNADSDLVNPNNANSVLNCDLNGVGTTTVDVIVSDGQATDTATLTINVYDDAINHPPEFTDNLSLYYEYHIDLVNVDVVDLADYSFDLDGDDLFFYVDESNTNLDVVNCQIYDPSGNKKIVDSINDMNTIDNADDVNDPNDFGSVLNCDLNGVGITTVDVIVSDGQAIDTATIAIKVYDDQPQNTAPYFNNLALFYSYPLNLSSVDVVDLSQYAYDDEFDTVTFSLDQSGTDLGVANCSLVDSTVIGVPPTPFDGPSLLHCDLNGVGITTVKVAVSDDEFTTWTTIKIQVYETGGNNPPYFENLQLYYSYNIDLANVNVVNLENHAVDPDGDDLDYLLDESNTNLNIADCDLIQDPTGPYNGPESVLNCDLNGVGTTTVNVGITDGYYTTWATITIHVYELGGNNTAPYFGSNMQLYYSFNIINSPAHVVDLSLFAYDDEFDTVKFDIDQSNTNLNVANCHLEESAPGGFPPTPFVGPNLLVCDLNGVGTTTLRVIVSDGQLSSYVDLTINVYSTNPLNTAPYFGEDLYGNNMSLYYSYNFDLITQTDVVHLAPYAHDDEGDTVSFTLDQSNTNFSVAMCTLNYGNDVPSPTPYLDPSILNCVFNGVGTTTVDVTITDGSLSSTVTITINVYDTQGISPIAIISSPGTSGFEGESKIVDGSQSYSPIGLDIVNYQWTITDIYGNSIYSTNGAASFPFTFVKGTYYIALTVVDSNGATGSTTKTYKVYLDSSADDRAENGLKIISTDVYGYDYERANLGGDLVITAWVENQAGVDLNNVRMTYALPEFGIRFTSQGVSIDDGDREYIQIFAQVPCCDLDPGVYYPYISFSDGDIRRVKSGYLEVYP